MSKSPQSGTANRVLSIDAYRGFVMLAMASSGFGFSMLAKPENLQKLRDAKLNFVPEALWKFLAYQFDHVVWSGCSFWDLIQPSFMFLVGVALPFSYSRRESEGQSASGRFLHVLWRSFVLVALGVFLSSNGAKQTNFTFVNVLSQIGLGYPLLYLLRERSLRTQLVAAAVILVGYWGWFANYSIPPQQLADVKAAISDRDAKLLAANRTIQPEPTPMTGIGSHWNKHVNAAAGADRKLLNAFPSEKEPFHGKTFWINDGGYQTLNFIPSLATMLFGLMAGTLLRSGASDSDKVKWLLKAGACCFAVSMALDTSIWPITIPSCDWHLAPIVKRIWSPGWAVFSTGWTFWMLAAFYWVIDVRQWRLWSWPLVIVGMNSIAMYVMAQLMKNWVGASMKTHLTTVDAIFGWQQGIAFKIFGEYPLATPLGHAARLFGLWLICVWLYRRKIFVRV
ncbi:MAG: DUF5009 domain-containing protein [Planctomycetia bacterium]|nr:DUF5009 domain-containing protein [Planctomycetia bacterium]